MSMETEKRPSRDALRSEAGISVESRVAWFQHMQKTQPVRYRPDDNLWEVFRYKDVEQVLLDPATFSVEKCQPEELPFLLAKSDPPEHRRLRTLVSRVFTPRYIEALRPRLIQIVDELLEPAISRGKMNVATEFASLLPVRVITEILGLPLEDQEHLLQWSFQMLSQMLGISNPDNNELLSYFSEKLNERRSAPRDDLISALLTVEENGFHLTHEQIIDLCLELLTAATFTTTMLLNHAFSRFCQHPEIYQALYNDPSLIPGAIEETLRYDFFPSNIWRTARHDTILSGQQIKAGQYVAIWTGAANFDETYFPKALQFDIRRSPNPHLTFGRGTRFCLGASLTRLEGRITFERFVAHFSEIGLDPNDPVQYMEHMGSSKIIKSLGILFTPATRN